MLRKIFTHGASLSSLALASAILTGCGDAKTGAVQNSDATVTAAVDDGGWWCVEHGVPEDECALCDPSLVAKFKAAGDWCEEHNRPESQCFLCSTKRFDKFAARYEAKFGVKPPKPTIQ
jgi:hypothetical protein